MPELGGIVARKLGRVAYAIYAAQDFPVGRPAKADPVAALIDHPWLGFDDDHGYMPGQQWLLEQLAGRRPAVRGNNWLVLHEATRAGAGLAVLPCYLGDPDPALKRVGGVIAEVFADQWLLVHRDLRALPRVRAVMDAVIELFSSRTGAARRPNLTHIPQREPSGASLIVWWKGGARSAFFSLPIPDMLSDDLNNGSESSVGINRRSFVGGCVSVGRWVCRY